MEETGFRIIFKVRISTETLVLAKTGKFDEKRLILVPNSVSNTGFTDTSFPVFGYKSAVLLNFRAI
jgi:hypothetical protein